MTAARSPSASSPPPPTALSAARPAPSASGRRHGRRSSALAPRLAALSLALLLICAAAVLSCAAAAPVPPTRPAARRVAAPKKAAVAPPKKAAVPGRKRAPKPKRPAVKPKPGKGKAVPPKKPAVVPPKKPVVVPPKKPAVVPPKKPVVVPPKKPAVVPPQKPAVVPPVPRPSPPPLRPRPPPPPVPGAPECGPLAGGRACPAGECCSNQGACGTGRLYCVQSNCNSGACWAPVQLEPFVWAALSAGQKRKAEQLLSIFENSSLEPAYGYAENLDDGRGITFGRSGFCTGTGDGVLVVRKYCAGVPPAPPPPRPPPPRPPPPKGVAVAKPKLPQPAKPPVPTRLCDFLPALELIDKEGGGDNVRGLTGFVQAVEAMGDNALWRKTQDDFAHKLYMAPSQNLAKALGLRLPLSKAQLYDAYIQHGEADQGSRVYDISANGMADWVTKKLGRSPLQGMDETVWITWFLDRRRWVLANTGSEWAASVQRVDLYKWLLAAGGQQLGQPIRLTWDKCRPGGERGPCDPQPSKAELAIGGIIYGNFLLP